MDCAMDRDLLGAYVDGELLPGQAAEVAEHLTTCERCSAEADMMLKTVRRLREGLVRDRAPDVLRARIRAALHEERITDAPAPRRVTPFPWRAVAAGLLIAAASSVLTLVATRSGSTPAGNSTIADEVVASHIRSLMPGHLTDVESNDQHNVKPWFNGRLDFSPVVPRLDSLGFPLLGGRLDYIGTRPVAVVIYGRRKHVINVFSWPADSGGDMQPSAVGTRHGYNIIRWKRGGVESWTASDLNADELRQFVELLRAGTPPRRE